MSKIIIVLGANGMAGHVITSGLMADSAYKVISIARTKSLVGPDIIMDVTDFPSISRLIRNIDVDIIINCIGLLNKTAEENPDQAILVNSYLPLKLESLTRGSNTKIIHISTDCVFSGKEGSYIETEFKNGIGFYAQSKALGELNNTKDLTFRTSIIGPELNTNGIGLFHWFSKQEGEINGYTNAFWTGITTIELLNAIKVAISENLTGLYHLVNNCKISKFELLHILNDNFGKRLTINPYHEYKSDKSLINTRADFTFKVKFYEEMVVEMKNWLNNNKNLYPHYRNIMNS